MTNENDRREFEEAIARYNIEFSGRLIAIPGYEPVGRVTNVDEDGAWLEDGSRITTSSLHFYHPVEER